MSVYESPDSARDIVARYQEKTRGSEAHLTQAKKWLPGGDTRRVSFYPPHPLFLERGEGCYVHDCDGNKYIDMQNNYSSLIHGHAHPRIEAAAVAQLKKGTALGSAAEIQYRHAEHLCRRISALESVRYTNSGTEATMFALRTARAYTGRHTILKMDGGYHGSHDFALVNQFPDLEAPGGPRVWAEPWVPAGVKDHVLVVPFNDLEATENILKNNKDQIAAILMEPVLGAGGGVAPRPGYLRGMRELADRYGVLLIFDEVMTFRVHYGGAQTEERVAPDLTALGKIIGGGFPVGAFGGRKEIMELYNPAHPRSVFHSGTFCGNNITLAAGLMGLELYDPPAVARLNDLAARLRNGFNRAFQNAGLAGYVSGRGSLLSLHWRDDVPVNSKDAIFGILKAKELPGLVHLEMINQGVHAAPRGFFNLSTPMSEREVDLTIAAFERTLAAVKPYVNEVLPHLIRG
ncbi:MAG: aminotransferase class III-fold pyridoxal phosphate-dependent enzyme [Thermodesulfobacteriota bacterium]